MVFALARMILYPVCAFAQLSVTSLLGGWAAGRLEVGYGSASARRYSRLQVFPPSWEVVLISGVLALSELLAVAALRLLPRFSLQLLAFTLCWTGEVRRLISRRIRPDVRL